MSAINLIDALITLAIGTAFFAVALKRSYSLWGKPMSEELRLLRRIEATSYFIASEVVTIYLWVRWAND